jgi:hypothetical protein
LRGTLAVVSPTVRNVLIVAAIAAAVALLPGGGDTATFVGSALSTAILASFVLIGMRAYRENRMTLFGLGDQHRGMLYGGVGAVVVALAGRERLVETGPGTLVFFVALFGAAYCFYAVWRHHREYGI